jgi:hypothetical protein
MATIIDLLDDVIGEGCSLTRIGQLTKDELDRLADGVAALYATEPQAVDLSHDEISVRFYSGGWVARNIYGPLSSDLMTLLVYSPAVIIHDPVAEWFNRHRPLLRGLAGLPSAQLNAEGRPAMVVAGDESTTFSGSGYYVSGNPVDESRAFLSEVVPPLYELGPLIRGGIMVPIDEIGLIHRMQAEIHAAVSKDIRDEDLFNLIADLNDAGTPPTRANNIRGAEVTPSGGIARGNEMRSIVQNPAFYFEKSLAIADAANARYVTPWAADAALLEWRLMRLGQRLSSKTNGNSELRMTPALVHAELPFLNDIDPGLLLRIRANEQSFEDWRSELRNAVRLIDSLPSEGQAFETEARHVLQDHLRPRAEEVRKAVSASTVMRAAAADGVADLSISAASIVGAGLIFGPSGIAVSGVTVGLALPLKWAYRVLFRPSPTGANAVLAQLVKRP